MTPPYPSRSGRRLAAVQLPRTRPPARGCYHPPAPIRTAMKKSLQSIAYRCFSVDVLTWFSRSKLAVVFFGSSGIICRWLVNFFGCFDFVAMLDIKPTADYLSRSSTFGQFSMLFGNFSLNPKNKQRFEFEVPSSIVVYFLYRYFIQRIVEFACRLTITR